VRHTHALGSRNRTAPAAGAWWVLLRLIGRLATSDARRWACWLSAACPVLGLLALRDLPSHLVLPLGWATGVLAAVMAIGHLPLTAGLIGVPGRERLVAWAWSLERGLWPSLVMACMWVLGEPKVAAAGLGGLLGASLLLGACRRLGCSTADGISGTLALTVVASVIASHWPDAWQMGVGIGRFLTAWVGLAMGLVAASAQVDRSVSLSREGTAGSAMLGHSELRRWFFRLMMAVVLVAMVRWLFASEPEVGLYGLAGGLLAASLVLPEVFLTSPGASADDWFAIVGEAGGRRSFRQRWQRSMLAVVVTGWPLLIAVLLVPATRNVETVLAAAAMAVVVVVAEGTRAAVRQRWLSGETAFAVAAIVIWGLAVLGIRLSAVGGLPAA
jgi:hypothetical protein